MSDFEIYSPESSRRHSPSPTRTLGGEGSPSRFDLDFQRRRADRLEEDHLLLTEEINRLRVKLRTAQDYQLKYDTLLTEKCELQEKNELRERQLQEITAEKEALLMRLKQKSTRKDDVSYEKERILKEVAVWREKAIQAEERVQQVASEEKEKAKAMAQKEVAEARRALAEAEESRQLEVGRLVRQLQEREVGDSQAQGRQERQAKEKEQQIGRLERTIQKMREDYLALGEEKNKEIERAKDKFQQLLSSELSSLQNSVSSQDAKFRRELEGLKTLLELKNEDIANLQRELQVCLQEQSRTRQELNSEIQLLRSKIYERERENEQQLFNLKERLAVLHAADLAALRTHYEALLDSVKDERGQLEQLLRDKQEKVDHERRDFQRGQADSRALVAERDREIAELKVRLASFGQSSSNQVGSLQRTLTRFADEKELLSNEYQSNLSFLNQQVTKLAASNQLKNNEIRELHEYVAFLKKEHFEATRELESKWRSERKEREAEREKERDLRQQVEAETREKEKQWKGRERELEMSLQKEKREKNRWATDHLRLEKEIERLLKEIAEMEAFRQQDFSKSQTAVLTGGGSKRELMAELERQKADFEALKRMEVEQVRKSCDLELTRLSNQVEKLQGQLSAKRIDYEKLEDQFRKVSSQYRNLDKINKDKLADYSQKMAALNSEILLTQNLYQALVGAKSKVRPER